MTKAATIAATATEPETPKNGDTTQNGSAAGKHDNIPNVDVGGEDEEESDDYEEDEGDYEEDRQIVGDEDDEEEGEEGDDDYEDGDSERKDTLTHLLLGNGNAPVAGDDDKEDDEDEDEDDEYVVENDSAKTATKKRSFDEVADEDDAQGAKKIKA